MLPFMLMIPQVCRHPRVQIFYDLRVMKCTTALTMRIVRMTQRRVAETMKITKTMKTVKATARKTARTLTCSDTGFFFIPRSTYFCVDLYLFGVRKLFSPFYQPWLVLSLQLTLYIVCKFSRSPASFGCATPGYSHAVPLSCTFISRPTFHFFC